MEVKTIKEFLEVSWLINGGAEAGIQLPWVLKSHSTAPPQKPGLRGASGGEAEGLLG